MRRVSSLILLLALVFSLAAAGSLFAIRNICDSCGQVADPEVTVCGKCEKPLNACLACETLNRVDADFCSRCNEDLSVMRVLATIDPLTRDELRLGQSDRARLERSLARLNYLLEKDPDNAEKFLYRKAKVYQQMAFWAGEANAWADLLKKFPDSPKKARIQGFQSEALRKWGCLFYQQNQKVLALEKFKIAAEINPLNTEAWLWAGRCAMEADETSEAGEFYLNGLKSNPGNKTAIHFLRKLKKSVPKDLLKAANIPAPSTPAK